MKLFSIVFSTLIPILLHPLPLQWYYGFLTGELAPPDAYLDEPAPNNRIMLVDINKCSYAFKFG